LEEKLKKEKAKVHEVGDGVRLGRDERKCKIPHPLPRQKDKAD
jgi:hypothetical protein